MPLDLILPHADGDCRLLHGEHAAEAAALVFALGFFHRDTFHELQQVDDFVERGNVLLRGRGEAQLAHAMATVVYAHHVGEPSRHAVHPQHIVQKLYDIHNLLGGDALVLAFQHMGIIDSHVGRTRGGGGHHIVEVLEQVFKILGQILGHTLEARIGHGLPAACLPLGIGHVESVMLEQFVCSHAGFRIQCVYIAGDE